jgi:RNA polymerase sigma-70 factor (ECF subfamily)
MFENGEGATVDDERELPPVVWAGDRGAFDELVRRHRARVFRLCLRLLGDHDWAEELTQRTFVRAWVKRPLFRASEGSFGTWILTIARRLCHKALKRKLPRKALFDELADVDSLAAEDDTDRPGDLDMLAAWREVERLPVKWQTAFLLYLEGRSPAEIMAEMGVSRGYVDVLLCRARERLQERCAPALPDAVWRRLEDRLSGTVTDHRLVRVKVERTGATLQLWVPVLDLSRRRDFAERLQAIQRSVAECPEDWQAWMELAAHHLAAGEVEQAAEACHRLTTITDNKIMKDSQRK